MAVFAMNYWEACFLMVLESRGLPWGSVGWNAVVSRAGPDLSPVLSGFRLAALFCLGPHHPSLCFLHYSTLSNSDSCFFIRKYLCNWISTNSMFWINQNKAPHVKIFNTIIFIKSLLPYKAILKALGVRIWTHWGTLISAHHSTYGGIKGVSNAVEYIACGFVRLGPNDIKSLAF